MEVLKKMAEKAKELASVATRKTEKTVEISRLKMRLNQTETMLKSTFERIGTLVYEESQGFAENSDLTELCINEATNLITQKKGLMEKIALLKQNKVCEKCGKTNSHEKT